MALGVRIGLFGDYHPTPRAIPFQAQILGMTTTKATSCVKTAIRASLPCVNDPPETVGFLFPTAKPAAFGKDADRCFVISIK